jgi:hypothetical protein
MKIDRFYWWAEYEIMPESNSESNKKKLERTLVHFLREKNR